MNQLVLSIFPGIDLLGHAFEEEGFCIVRGPDVIFGGDIRGWHVPAGRFDGVLGGPPCQCFSRLAHMVRHNGYQPKFGNLIPEFERVVMEAQPRWFLMEEVPEAPVPTVPGYEVWSTLLNNRQCIDADGKPAKQNRVRRWSFGAPTRTVLMIETAALHNPEFEFAALGGAHGNSPAPGERDKMKRGGSVPIKLSSTGQLKPALRERENNDHAAKSQISRGFL